jgi:hypothetical protein
MIAEAIWVVSDFAVPEKGWRRLAARIVIRGLYFAFSFLTRLRVHQIPNYAKAFEDNRFRLVDNADFLGGLLVTEVWKRRSD